ncbi:MAG: hypothetical protein JW839_02450 [Candidatus Lokiarchaeota archaeon]|nr:hypothetical protein [Candidatus Lokiarchaeota archaeon]
MTGEGASIMIPQSSQHAEMVKNARRVISLFEKSINTFYQRNMPELAGQWSRILNNYKRSLVARLRA